LYSDTFKTIVHTTLNRLSIEVQKGCNQNSP
jgi:hypothetical protein